MDSHLQYLTFDEVGITVIGIAVLLAFVSLVLHTVKDIDEFMQSRKKPTDDRFGETKEKLDDYERRISHLEECCDEVHEKLKCDWEFQQDETEMNRLMLKSIKQLLKHSIDGNDTSGLKHMEDEIDNYLVDHAQ